MKKRIYIGADGGGTKTALAASTGFSREMLPGCEGASINYNLIGVRRAAENFAEAVRQLSLPKDGEIAGIAIGDPSIDDCASSPMTENFISLVRQSLSLAPQCPVLVRSDLYMTLYGMTEGKSGAIMVSGTGSMGMAIDAKGALHVVGGWGQLTEDEGSGYYIAVNGIKAALRYFDGTGPDTVLLEAMKHYFHIDDPRRFILEYYADKSAFPDIAGFGKIVGETADTDKEARKIVYVCADQLTAGMLALMKRARLQECKIGIYGSVLLRNMLVRERFEKGVKSAYPGAQIIVPAVKPEEAALMYIMNQV